ncbi:hypothetical protein CTRI78_v000878 [Colletotrichum trifolii]|uniref:Uncharacterized protein n=1 Tax=Colletotrichum trifolii TaxID=5466 RepID=A0A4R8RRK9_COLTR|nr:hypothetical protein CTRI78_v000878 [Colletotrichum trifolii]
MHVSGRLVTFGPPPVLLDEGPCVPAWLAEMLKKVEMKSHKTARTPSRLTSGRLLVLPISMLRPTSDIVKPHPSLLFAPHSLVSHLVSKAVPGPDTASRSTSGHDPPPACAGHVDESRTFCIIQNVPKYIKKKKSRAAHSQARAPLPLRPSITGMTSTSPNCSHRRRLETRVGSFRGIRTTVYA